MDSQHSLSIGTGHHSSGHHLTSPQCPRRIKLVHDNLDKLNLISRGEMWVFQERRKLQFGANCIRFGFCPIMVAENIQQTSPLPIDDIVVFPNQRSDYSQSKKDHHLVRPLMHRSIVYPLLFNTNIMGVRSQRIMVESSCTVSCLGNSLRRIYGTRTDLQGSITDKQNCPSELGLFSSQCSSKGTAYSPPNTSPKDLRKKQSLFWERDI